jgi:hypothetical protein
MTEGEDVIAQVAGAGAETGVGVLVLAFLYCS